MINAKRAYLLCGVMTECGKHIYHVAVAVQGCGRKPQDEFDSHYESNPGKSQPQLSKLIAQRVIINDLAPQHKLGISVPDRILPSIIWPARLNQAD